MHVGEWLQSFARRHRYVLRADIVQHFASADHAILLAVCRPRGLPIGNLTSHLLVQLL
jgi:hypothetical protein